MQRNWTIWGLSGALVVIEARKSGGTFEAGKLALRLKLPLFVVEYAEPEASATGNLYFLKHGAHALRRNIETGRADLRALRQTVEMSFQAVHAPVQPQLL